MIEKTAAIEAEYKTNVMTWALFLASQIMFAVVIFFVNPELYKFEFSKPFLEPSIATIGGFALSAVLAVVFSFAFRRRLEERAIDQREPDLVRNGLIIALAFCEASTLFGVALAIGFEHQYFFLWIILAITAIVFHFPRRTAIAAAYR